MGLLGQHMDIKSIVANVAIGGAGGAAILKFIDWLLSDAQRKRLTDFSVSFWNWIDETRKTRLIMHFRGGRPQLFLAVGAQIIAIVLVWIGIFLDTRISDLDGEMLVRSSAVVLGSVVAVGLEIKWVLRIILTWLGKGRNQFFYILRCYAVSAGFALVGAAIVGTFDLLGHDVEVFGEHVLVIPEWQLLIFLATGTAAVTMMATVLMILILSMLAWVLMFALQTVFSIVEFIARRIAESPKGPLLSGSALIGGAAAIVKAFQ
jgi:hypothetical protein